MDRRGFVRNTATLGLGACGLMGATSALSAHGAPVAGGAAAQLGGAALGAVEFSLPPLPYAYDALAPFLSEETLRLHHDKHHQGYVNGLIAAEEKVMEARRSGDYDNIAALSDALAFHYSGHLLHSLYWTSMSPNGGGMPEGELLELMDLNFGDCHAFRSQFIAAGNKVQGSGWGVLAWQPLGQKLVVLQALNHQNCTQWGVTPIMVCDVWEHAYYVDYRNRRSDYTEAFFDVIDWSAVSQRLIEAKGAG